MNNDKEGRRSLPGEVFDKEVEYIKQRRFLLENTRQNAPTEEADGENLIGIALSGGGIRSATFCMGVLQGLAQRKVLPLVDYLSTVSGGGYIGSCISSLLRSDQSGKKDSEKVDTEENFPLFNADQIHHLRKHGDFLILQEGLFRRDVLRTFGLFSIGIISTFFLFLLPLLATVGLTITFLSSMGNIDLSPQTLGEIYWIQPSESNEETTLFSFQLRDKEISMITSDVSTQTSASQITGWNKFRYVIGLSTIHLWALLGGLLFGLYLMHSNIKKQKISYVSSIRGDLGSTREDRIQLRILTWTSFKLFLVIVGIWGSYVCALKWNWIPANLRHSQMGPEELYSLFPFMIFVAAFLGIWVGSVLYYIFYARFTSEHIVERKELDSRAIIEGWHPAIRSLLGVTSAICLNYLIGSLLFIMIIFYVWAVVGSHLGPNELNWTVDPQGGSWMLWTGILSTLLARLSATFSISTNEKSKPMRHLMSFASRFLLKVSVPVFCCIGFLLILEWSIFAGVNSSSAGIVLFIVSTIPFIIAGFLIDINRISPHYFYMDRISDTYLQTETPVNGELRITRDDSNLKVSELNQEGSIAPYHLILCSLNLAGSHDLAKRGRKSDHFIFSRFYCGSRTTGYVPTTKYDNGRTKVATAIAISGAAVNSVMGFYSSGSRAFALTFFNLRLGIWLPNPKKDKEAIFDKFRKPYTPPSEENEESIWNILNRDTGLTWWPRFLFREMTCTTNSNNWRINLSDGGHTEDNLGIYPLLQRRCKLIIVCDAENDSEYTCASLSNALRQIFIDENVTVDIDLTNIRPNRKGAPAKSHFTVGKIKYPSDEYSEESSDGWLLYIKSSLLHDYHADTDSATNDHKQVPPIVQSYAGNFSEFPHQSTIDQFFDDNQFEAYRALGEHITLQTINELKGQRKVKKHTRKSIIAWTEGYFNNLNKDLKNENHSKSE